jgi:hypothetical protein
MLNAMKANTKGMHAIHEARRSFKVDPNRGRFTTSVEPFGLSLLLDLDSYNTDATNLSSSQRLLYMLKIEIKKSCGSQSRRSGCGDQR